MAACPPSWVEQGQEEEKSQSFQIFLGKSMLGNAYYEKSGTSPLLYIKPFNLKIGPASQQMN